MNEIFIYFGVGLAAVGLVWPRLVMRLELSRAKHPSLTGHARMARHIAALIPFYAYPEARFFRSDSAPEAVAAARRDGFMRLSRLYRERYARTLRLTADAAP